MHHWAQSKSYTNNYLAKNPSFADQSGACTRNLFAEQGFAPQPHGHEVKLAATVKFSYTLLFFICFLVFFF